MILEGSKLTQRVKSEEVEETKSDFGKKRKRKFIPLPQPTIKYKQSPVTMGNIPQLVERGVHEKQNVESVEQAHKPEVYMKFEREKKKRKIITPVLMEHITKPKPQKIELPKIQTKQYAITPIKNVDKLAKDIAQKIYIQKEIEEGYVDEKKALWKSFVIKLQQIDPILIEALYLMCEIPKDISAIKSGYYKDKDLLKSLISTLQLNYDITNEKVTLIEQELFIAIREELNSNPLYLHKIEDMLSELCYPAIKDILLARIAKMSLEEKKIVLTFLLRPLEPWLFEDWQYKFGLYFDRCFNAKPKTDVLNILVKAGVMLKGKLDGRTLYKPIALLEKVASEIEKRLIEDIKVDLDHIFKKISEVDEELKLEEAVRKGRVEQDLKKWKEVLNMLKNMDFTLLDMLYTVAATSKGVTAVSKGYYTEEHLWKSVKRNMQIKYEISDEDFEKYREILYDTIQRKMYTNLLYLFRKEEDIIFEIIKEELLDCIKKRVQTLNDTDKKAILLFLCAKLETWDNWIKKFNILYETCFGETYEGDIIQVLVKSNVLVYGIWITSRGDYRGPQYVKPDSLPEISKYLTEFLSTEVGVDTKTLTNKIKAKLEELETPKVEEAGEITTEEIEAGSAEDIPQAEDLEIFEKIIKSDGKFPRNISNEKPVVIILPQSNNDNYGTTINILCREIFRELAGGLPEGKIRSNEDKDIEKDLRAEYRIEYIDDSRTEYVKNRYSKIKTFDDFKKCINWEKLSDRLQELIFQGFGFIIFEVKRDFVGMLKTEIEKLTGDRRPQILVLSPYIEGPSLLIIRKNLPKELDLKPIKKEIASLCWGMVNPQGDDRWSAGKTFDNFFSACENAFYEKLKAIGNSPIKIDGRHIPSNLIVKGGEDLDFQHPPEESNYHYWMKVFVVKYLIEKKKIPPGNISTEEPLSPNGLIPDVRANNVIIEVETLYGTGRPLDKLTKTLRKYRNSVYDVWIVIKNLDVLFYYPELVQLLECVNKEWNVNCKFFTLDLSRKELIDIKVMGGKINNLINQVDKFERDIS